MIYLDYNAATPIDKRVSDAMLPYIHGNLDNPSSSHELGVAAKKAVEYSRKQGVSDEAGRGAVRFSLRRYTTNNEIDIVIANLNKVIFI